MKAVATRTRQSSRSLRVCAMFGIRPVQNIVDEDGPERLGAAREIDRLLPRGAVAFITGPSGGGKTRLLRAVERVISPRSSWGVARASLASLSPVERASPIVDLFGHSAQTALRHLSRVGLAEPALFPLCVDELSEGQRSRLAIALAMSRVERQGCGQSCEQGGEGDPADEPGGGTVLIDELGSSLDATSALTLAASLSRCAARSGVRVVCAGVRDELLEPLRPAVLALVSLAGAIRVVAKGARERV